MRGPANSRPAPTPRLSLTRSQIPSPRRTTAADPSLGAAPERSPIHNSKFIIPNCVFAALLTLAAFSADVARAADPFTDRREKPHVPPWSVSRPPVPSQTPQVTPGGTFDRPVSTFSPQTGTFSRPTSTFASPASSYTPLPPVQVPVEDPRHPRHPHGRRPVNLYPETVIVHNPTVYEPYYVEVPVPVEAAAPADTQPAAEAPVVIDLPPGATIRRPAAPEVTAPAATATSAVTPASAPAPAATPTAPAPVATPGPSGRSTPELAATSSSVRANSVAQSAKPAPPARSK